MANTGWSTKFQVITIQKKSHIQHVNLLCRLTAKLMFNKVLKLANGKA